MIYFLKSLFSKESREKSNIERMTKKLTNVHQQSVERKRVINLLADIGTYDAIYALLKRFTVRAEKTIEDEEEKQIVYQTVVSLGENAVQPLNDFIKKEISVFWPLKALSELMGKEKTIDFLIYLIDRTEAIFDMDVARKIEYVSNLREFDDRKVFEKLYSLISDDNEEIRVHAIEGLGSHESEEVMDLFIDRLVDENETQRIKSTILNLLIDNKWKIKKKKAQILKVIPPTYWIDDTGIIRRR
jgi:hypothetical protein